MSDNTAILAGYTKEWLADCDVANMHIFAKPDEDFDSRFRAYDADNCEWVFINGWLWTFEEV